MGLGAAPPLVGLNVIEGVGDLAAELVVVRAGFQPAPTLKGPRTDAPAPGQLLLVQVGGEISAMSGS